MSTIVDTLLAMEGMHTLKLNLRKAMPRAVRSPRVDQALRLLEMELDQRLGELHREQLIGADGKVLR